MSVINASAQPCWELPHDEDADWWAHYTTEAEALKDLDPPLERGEVVKAKQLTRICVHLVCDGCGDAVGMEGELTDEANAFHIDPADLDYYLEDPWITSDDGRHWCGYNTCSPPDDVARDLSREPGPDDVPLPGMESS